MKNKDTEASVKYYIQKNLNIEWDEKTKQWNKSMQNTIDMFDIEEIMDENNCDPLALSNNDITTILKDCKSVLSNINQITKRMDGISKDIKRVANDINELVVAIGQRQN